LNEKPTADAGDDDAVAVNQLVTLDGTGSSDPENRPLTYQWSHYSGREATLSDDTSATPSFTPTYAGKAIYKFKLIVNNGIMESEPDYVIIATGLPVADAGGDQEAKVGQYISIFSYRSQPSPGGPDITGYLWKVYQKPDEFNIDLPHTFTDKTYIFFLARYVGIYIFKLQVIDADEVKSYPTYVTITVTGERGNPLSMDSDNDGVSDGHEYHIFGTKVNNKDSDDDGLLDGQELGYKVSDVTRDTDLSVFKEDADYGYTTTDPTLSDTDGDGLCDGWDDKNGNSIFDDDEGEDEDRDGYIDGDSGSGGRTWGKMDTGENWEETSPNLVDSDEDGLWDGGDFGENLGELDGHDVGGKRIYVNGFLIYATPQYPFTPTENKNRDSDGDGLLDGEEITGWIHNYNIWKILGEDLIELRRYFSDPNAVDSEGLGTNTRGDGVPDNIEKIHGTNPMNDDTDEDGLEDSFEINDLSVKSPDELAVWNSIPNNVDDKPDPLKKDIYIEVDWMEGEVLGNRYLNYIKGANEKVECNHKMDPDAKRKIINAFKNSPVTNCDGSNGIRLHIDDGTGDWNGGENIPHKNKIEHTTKGKEYNNLFNNKGLEGFGNYGFTPERIKFFHYSVFAHDSDESGIINTKNGYGVYAGNKFVIYNNNIGNTKEEVHVFMHELGHNLLGVNDPNENDHNSKANHLDINGHHDNSDCIMKGKYSIFSLRENYCYKCWMASRLDWCL
jgi:hypothetical protein